MLKVIPLILEYPKLSALLTSAMLVAHSVALASAGAAPEPFFDGTNTWFDGRWLYANGMLEGRAFDDTARFYDRLPASAEGQVGHRAWSKSRMTAGYCARFIADAPEITIEWTLSDKPEGLRHMPSTGTSGFDVYVLDRARGWRWASNHRADSRQATAVFIIPPKRPAAIYFPLYNGVDTFRLGVRGPGRTLAPPPPRTSGVTKPVVFYGTSITQGACASRPRLAWVASTCRDLDLPFVNLGFAGSGNMELPMADILARIDAACYVLDTLWNMGAGDVKNRYAAFIRALRAKRPDVPILLAEDPWFDNTRSDRAKTARLAFEKLQADGLAGLHYLRADAMYPFDGEACKAAWCAYVRAMARHFELLPDSGSGKAVCQVLHHMEEAAEVRTPGRRDLRAAHELAGAPELQRASCERPL